MVRQRISWRLVAESTSVQEAMECENKLWKKSTTYRGSEFTKYLFNCSSKYCEAKMMVQDVYTPAKVLTYRAYEHSSLCGSQIVKPTVVKEKVLACLSKGIKLPFYIQKELEKESIAISSKNISAIKYRAKVKVSQPTYNDIGEQCERILSSTNNQILIKQDYSNGKVRILMTHTELLEKTSWGKIFHLDGTYKLLTLNFPVLVFGVSDNNGSFHLSAICICNDESADAYGWCIQVLLDLYQENDLCFEPKNIVGDAAPQIDLIARQMFPAATRTHCWAHAWRNMSKHILRVDAQRRAELDEDIHLLQRLNTEALFKVACTLFLQKWNNFASLSPVIDLIESQYLNKDNEWYEGNYIFGPSTNNCLEAFNSTLKKRYCNWARTGIVDFIKLVELVLIDQNMLSKAKHIINNPFKVMQYASKAEISPGELSFEYLGSNGETCWNLVITSENHQSYEKAKEQIKYKLFNSSYESFLELSRYILKFPIITAKNNINSYEDAYCSCYGFIKSKKCNHVYAYFKKVNKLAVINVILLSNKQSRGRPKKIEKGNPLQK